MEPAKCAAVARDAKTKVTRGNTAIQTIAALGATSWNAAQGTHARRVNVLEKLLLQYDERAERPPCPTVCAMLRCRCYDGPRLQCKKVTPP